MGWAVGFVDSRDVGYGVPSICDYPTCKKKIDRGLSYICGGFVSDNGCNQFFCEKHLQYTSEPAQIEAGVARQDADLVQFCERCAWNAEHPDDPKPTFDIKPDTKKWLRWKLKNSTWADWRAENPKEVENIKLQLGITK